MLSSPGPAGGRTVRGSQRSPRWPTRLSQPDVKHDEFSGCVLLLLLVVCSRGHTGSPVAKINRVVLSRSCRRPYSFVRSGVSVGQHAVSMSQLTEVGVFPVGCARLSALSAH